MSGFEFFFLLSQLKLFWNAAKKILPFCYNVVRTIRKKSPDDPQLLEQIESVLKYVHAYTRDGYVINVKTRAK